jgi:hypothetical protein
MHNSERTAMRLETLAAQPPPAVVLTLEFDLEMFGYAGNLPAVVFSVEFVREEI